MSTYSTQAMHAMHAMHSTQAMHAMHAMHSTQAMHAMHAMHVAGAANPMIAQALTMQREGLSGEWHGVQYLPAAVAEVDSVDALDNWSPQIRAALFDQELNGSTMYAACSHDGHDGYRMWVAADQPESCKDDKLKLNLTPLVTMTPPGPAADAERQHFIAQQLEYLKIYSDLRAERMSEIFTELSPVEAYWLSVIPIKPARLSSTIEFLYAALRFASNSAQQFKQALNVARPAEYSSQLQPLVQTPSHGSLPSGHATEAYMIANVLLGIVAEVKKQKPAGFDDLVLGQAERIAKNRTVAGLHFPMDSVAGCILGTGLAEFFLAKAKSGAYRQRTYHGRALANGAADFSGDEAGHNNSVIKQGHEVSITSAPRLNWLWRRVIAEWGG